MTSVRTTRASFVHQNNTRTHVFFDESGVVFGDFDENDELLLFASLERRRRENDAFVRDDDFDDEEKE